MVVGIGILYQLVTDPFAIAWHAWFLSDDKTLGIQLLNFPIEETVFIIFVSIAIASATLVFIQYQEKGKLNTLFSSRIVKLKK